MENLVADLRLLIHERTYHEILEIFKDCYDGLEELSNWLGDIKLCDRLSLEAKLLMYQVGDLINEFQFKIGPDKKEI